MRHYKFGVLTTIVIIGEVNKTIYYIRIKLSKYIKISRSLKSTNAREKTIAHETADNIINDRTGNYILIVNVLLLNLSLMF